LSKSLRVNDSNANAYIGYTHTETDGLT